MAVAHGGAMSLAEDRDGPQAASELAVGLLQQGRTVLEAAVEGCALLEDDPRFNAGTGSNLRLDGRTIEMDASCMTSDGAYGAVACMRDVRNPVRVAHAALGSNAILAGEGATQLAREIGQGPFDVRTSLAVRKFEAARKLMRVTDAENSDTGQSLATIRRHWNYEVGLREAFGESDTVGVLVSDGMQYAGASSTGGTISTLLGRVGDVPMPGCGLHVGPEAAVAVTGDGDFLARKMLARTVYQDLIDGIGPSEAIERAIAIFPPLVDVGVILLHGSLHAGGSNRGMAWAVSRVPANALESARGEHGFYTSSQGGHVDPAPGVDLPRPSAATHVGGGPRPQSD